MCFGCTGERAALFLSCLTAGEGGFRGQKTGRTLHHLCMRKNTRDTQFTLHLIFMHQCVQMKTKNDIKSVFIKVVVACE